MNRKLLLIFFSALALRIVLSPLVWHPDLNNHIDWGIKFFEYGVNKFYAPESNVWAYTWPNQPPGTIFIFAIVRKVYEFIFNFFWQINTSVSFFPSTLITWMDDYLYPMMLKGPAIVADLGIAYLIYKIILNLKKNKRIATIGLSLFLFNPVIWYNSATWGQSDSTINFFALLSLYFLFKKKAFLSVFSFAICLYIKLSLVIFIPLFVILYIKQRFNFRKSVLAFAVSFLVILLATLPFTDGKEPVGWLFTLYREKILVNQMQVITANAFNFWAALTGIYEKSHFTNILFMSYQSWGNLLFIVLYLPLLYMLWKRPTITVSMWVFSLTAFTSWMFLTNMHERYLYPLFPYFTILTALNLKMIPLYIGVSAINLLNLYHLWWWPEIAIIKSVMSAGDRVVARILGGLNIILFINLYSQFIRIKDEKK